MARVTIEDCLKNVENRFDLVIKASERAHMLEMGAADPQVPEDNDKPTVIALREIAEGKDITKRRVPTEEMFLSEEETATFGTPSAVPMTGHPTEPDQFKSGE